jgi:hypothetical protein
MFKHRVGFALLWGLLVAGIAVAVNVAGVHVVGSIDGWERWLHAHAAHFFVRQRRRINACCASRLRP